MLVNFENVKENLTENGSAIFDKAIKKPNFYFKSFFLTCSMPTQSFKIIPTDSVFDSLSLLKRFSISIGQWSEEK